MNLSHAYGAPPSGRPPKPCCGPRSICGVTHLRHRRTLWLRRQRGTASARCSSRHRADVMLASKCGMSGTSGRARDRRAPRDARRTCDDSLAAPADRRHRPLLPASQGPEGAGRGQRRRAGRPGAAGKVSTIGLSEVSAATLRARARRASDTRHPERILAVDAQPGDRRARRLPRAGRRVRRLQSAGARLPLWRAARPGSGARADGHPPRDAALPPPKLRAQPAAARRVRRHRRRGRLHARAARARLAACRGSRSSCPFPDRHPAHAIENSGAPA